MARDANNEGLKIVYDDVAPYAKENSNPQIAQVGLYPRPGLYPGAGLKPSSTTIKQEFPELRRDDVIYPGYALCYPGFSWMNGQYVNVPDVPEDYGYISSECSDENGLFADSYYPVLTITFNHKYTSVGILLTFNLLSEDYATELNIKWYEEETLLSDMDFAPDTVRYFCNNYVQQYDKIVITFRKTSKPYRPVFITRIDYGIYRDFLDDELLDNDCLQEINTISENISINTLSFTVRTTSNIPFDLQKKQKLGLYFNGELLGNFYLKNGARKNKTDYFLDSHDAIGVLDGNEFSGGIYTGEKVSAVLDELFLGEDFEYSLDAAYRDTQLHGYIPFTTKRNALVQIAFAIGAIVDTSNGDNVKIYPHRTDVLGEFDNNDTFDGVTLEHNDIVTGIRLTVHSYQKNEESEELFNDTLNGTAEIVFSDPHHSLSITGGEIKKSGSNYAIVAGTGANVVLTGKKYTHITNQLLKENPDIVFNKNIKEIQDATLISTSNAQQVIDRIYAYYQRAESVVGDVLLRDRKLRQVIVIDTMYDGKRTGTIESIDYSFTEEIKARVKIHE